MCVLDLSKVLMHEFHYSYIRNKHGNNARQLFTDTGCLMYQIKTEDVYEDFSKDEEMSDYSNYSAKSKFYYDSNKLVVGKMINKTAYVSLQEFAQLKPKMYSFLVDDDSEHNIHISIYIKQWTCWISSWLSELIIKAAVI